MDLFYSFLALVITGFLGYFFRYTLHSPKTSIIEIIAHSLLLGPGLVWIAMLFLAYLHLSFSLLNLLLSMLALLFSVTFIKHYIINHKLSYFKHSIFQSYSFFINYFHSLPHFKWYEYLLIALLIYQSLFVVIEAVAKPMIGWDAWAIWGMRTKMIYESHTIPVNALSAKSLYSVPHKDYPVLVNSFGVWISLWMGQYREDYSKIIHAYFYIAMLLMYFALLRNDYYTSYVNNSNNNQIGKSNLSVIRQNSRTHALIFTCILATTPIFVDHGNVGNANLAAALYLGIGSIVCLQGLRKNNNSALIVSGIYFGFCTQTRIEGKILVAIFLINVFTVCLLSKSYRKRDNFLAIGFLSTLAWLFTLPWQFFTKAHGISSLSHQILGKKPIQALLIKFYAWPEQVYYAVKTYAEEMIFSTHNSAGGSLDAKWNILWILLFIFIVLRFRKMLIPETAIYVVTVLSIVLLYIVLWLAPPTTGKYHSFDRYILHAAIFIPFILARLSRE